MLRLPFLIWPPLHILVCLNVFLLRVLPALVMPCNCAIFAISYEFWGICFSVDAKLSHVGPTVTVKKSGYVPSSPSIYCVHQLREVFALVEKFPSLDMLIVRLS